MHQNAVTCGPVKADMDRCAEAPGRMLQGNETAPPTSEAVRFSSGAPVQHADKISLTIQVSSLEQKVSELERLSGEGPCDERIRAQLFGEIFRTLLSLPGDLLGSADEIAFRITSLQNRCYAALRSDITVKSVSSSQPFRQVCASFLTPGREWMPKYVFSGQGQADILVGLPLPGYSCCGVREVDSLAHYHECLGRVVPFLREDLVLSFRQVCRGLIIGESREVDEMRVIGILNSLDQLFTHAVGVGNLFLQELVQIYFVLMDLELMTLGSKGCIRRICFVKDATRLLFSSYPIGSVTQCPTTVSNLLIPELTHILPKEQQMCADCSLKHCPHRLFLMSREVDIRSSVKTGVMSPERERMLRVKPLSRKQNQEILPFLTALQNAGYVDENFHWIRGKYPKPYAGWAARVIHYNVPSVSETQIGVIFDVEYILKAASDASISETVRKTVEGVFKNAGLSFSSPSGERLIPDRP